LLAVAVVAKITVERERVDYLIFHLNHLPQQALQ
jgi:hypothetical protein